MCPRSTMKTARSDRCSVQLRHLLLWGLLFHLCSFGDAAASKGQTETLHSSLSSYSTTKRSFDHQYHSSSSDPSVESDHELESYFDNATSTNVTAQLGHTAYLHCKVRHLGDRVVSWIRRRDFHILTVGLYTYSSDQRFQMHHLESSDDWTLLIKYTQKRDAGLYECQVSSDPPISLFTTLNVVVPKVEIVGWPELYVKTGSTISLTCMITHSPEPPLYVFWYHDGRMINYDTTRGGINVKTEKGETTYSTLVIANAQRSDSGNYNCTPSNADSTSITVHILNGDKPAAMQHESSSSGRRCSESFTSSLLDFVTVLISLFFSTR